MRGAAPKAIQELAGHQDLASPLRYMHLSPSARESAIALLNRRGAGETFWRHCGEHAPEDRKPREIVVEAPGIALACTEAGFAAGVQARR